MNMKRERESFGPKSDKTEQSNIFNNKFIDLLACTNKIFGYTQNTQIDCSAIGLLLGKYCSCCIVELESIVHEF